MSLKSTIRKYKENINLSLDGEKDFQFIHCKMSCRCIVGIKWDNLKFCYGDITTHTGFEYKLSMNLGNSLEFLYYPIIKNCDEIKTKIDREKQLNKLGI